MWVDSNDAIKYPVSVQKNVRQNNCNYLAFVLRDSNSCWRNVICDISLILNRSIRTRISISPCAESTDMSSSYQRKLVEPVLGTGSQSAVASHLPAAVARRIYRSNTTKPRIARDALRILTANERVRQTAPGVWSSQTKDWATALFDSRCELVVHRATAEESPLRREKKISENQINIIDSFFLHSVCSKRS